MIKAGVKTIRSEIHKLINYIWNKEQLPEEGKASIILPVYGKGSNKDCNNYKGISLLSTPYKILSNILFSWLTPNGKENFCDHQCGFRRNRPTTDHVFCIRQILEKKWEHNEALHHLLI